MITTYYDDYHDFIKKSFWFNECTIVFNGINIEFDQHPIMILEKKIKIDTIDFYKNTDRTNIKIDIKLDQKNLKKILKYTKISCYNGNFLKPDRLIDKLLNSVSFEIKPSFATYNMIASKLGSSKRIVCVKNNVLELCSDCDEAYIARNYNVILNDLTNTSPILHKYIDLSVKNYLKEYILKGSYYHLNASISKVDIMMREQIRLIVETIIQIKKYKNRGFRFI